MKEDILEYTASGQYYRVYKDGEEQSKHTTEREACQQAANLAFSFPDNVVHYIHDYEVYVGLTDAGITEAKDYGQQVDQPPTVDSTPSPSFTEGTADTYDMTQHVSDDGLSALTYSLTNTLPNGLSFNESTGILTYDGIGIPSVSSHTLVATDAVGSDTSPNFDITISSVAAGYAHGDSYTITGSGFGTRGDYNIDGYQWEGQTHIHYKFCDFSDDLPANGSSLSSIKDALKGWNVQTVGESATQDYEAEGVSIETGGPSQSGRYYQVNGITRQGGLIYTTEGSSPVPTTTNAYCCMYMRRTADNEGKFFRWVWGSGTNNFYLTFNGPYVENGWPGNWGGSAFWDTGSISTSQFDYCEIFVKDEATNFYRNGAIQTFDNSTMRGNGFADQQDIPGPPNGESHRGVRLSIPNSTTSVDGGTGDSGDQCHIADIYYDMTPARVELVQGSTKAIQLLTSWSDTSIDAVLNKGGLSSGSATVLVYDDSNTLVHTGSLEIV